MNQFNNGIAAGSTGIDVPVVLRAVADGTEMAAVAATSVAASYQRQGAAVTTFAVSALGSPTAAWSAGGWVAKDATNQPGHYRLDVPDAAWAEGANFVVVAVKVASAFVFYEKYPINDAFSTFQITGHVKVGTSPTATAMTITLDADSALNAAAPHGVLDGNGGLILTFTNGAKLFPSFARIVTATINTTTEVALTFNVGEFAAAPSAGDPVMISG